MAWPMIPIHHSVTSRLIWQISTSWRTHLHEVVDAVERGRYSGHVDGNTRHVHSMLDSLNGTIHRMERVVAAYSAPPSGCDVGRGHDGHRGHDDRSTRSRVAGAIFGAIMERSSHRGHRH